MSKEHAQLLDRLLEVPEADRAILAERLLASLDGPPDPDAETAWQSEIARRLDEIDSGQAKLIPWEEIRAELRNRPRAAN